MKRVLKIELLRFLQNKIHFNSKYSKKYAAYFLLVWSFKSRESAMRWKKKW